MGGIVKAVLRLVLFGWLAAWVGALIGAAAIKRSVVPVDAPDDDDVVLVAVFGELDFTSTARGFRGGQVECWFGGGVLDLRSATLDPFGADLRLRGVFGGGQVIVPSTWRVALSTIGLGGVVDSRPSTDVDLEAPELRIDSTVLFGGFQVTSEAPQRDAAGASAGVA